MSRWDWDSVAEKVFHVVIILFILVGITAVSASAYKAWNAVPRTDLERWGIGDYVFICEKTDHNMTCRLEGKQ